MKHPYSINLDERHSILLYVAALAFVLALGVGLIISWVGWAPPPWLDVPATGAIYFICYETLRHRGWKWKWLRAIGAIKTPVLDGSWIGEVKSSYDQHAQAHPVTVEIRQDWTYMAIVLKTDHSSSRSLSASISEDVQSVLTYTYYNEPSVGSLDTMHAHRGTATVALSADCKNLSGHYYSGRDRRECGTITLKRV